MTRPLMTDTLIPGLYIVATPIGNLGDLSPRAAHVLANAAAIAVEDTRVTAVLLRHIGVEAPDDRVSRSQCRPRPARPDRATRERGDRAGQRCGDAADFRPRLQTRARRARGGACGGDDPRPVRGGRGADARGTADRPLPVRRASCPPRPARKAEAIAEIAAIRATLVFYESGRGWRRRWRRCERGWATARRR